MLTEKEAIDIAIHYGREHEVSYEMIINEKTPEEALYACSIPIPNKRKYRIFINLSNHNTNRWDDKQINAIYDICNRRNDGVVITDIEFPKIDPNASEEDIDQLVNKYITNIKTDFDIDEGIVIHIMGEMTFVYKFINAFKSRNVLCIASTTQRNVVENENGEKVSKFEFVRFRKY